MTDNFNSIEIIFDEDEFIVSKTDLKGIITYVNDVFEKISGYTKTELINKPHSIIRHRDMPKAVFKLLWDELKQNKEVFAYVKNRTKQGNYYWVFAHVTPSFDINGEKVGYHSNRRKPKKESIEKISKIYRELLEVERSASSVNQGMELSYQKLQELLKTYNMAYDEFVFSI